METLTLLIFIIVFSSHFGVCIRMKNRFSLVFARLAALVIGGLTFLLLSPSIVWAKDAEFELDTIVVTASRISESKREVPSNITVISGEDVQKSTSETVLDVLKSEGIQTSWTGSSNYGDQRIIMRGASTSTYGFDIASDVLVLVDGRRAGTSNFAVLNMNNVERIEVVRGPGSVQYGSSAVGGVINIITKRGQEKPESHLEGGGGSFGAQRYKAFASGRSGKLDVAAWSGYATSGGVKDGRGKRLEYSGMNYMTKYGLNLGWNFNERNRLGFSLEVMEGDKLKNGPAGVTKYGTNQHQNREHYVADIVYDGGTEDETWSWLGRYYFGKTDYELSRESTGAKSMGVRENFSENKTDMHGSQVQLTYAGSNFFSLTGGVDMLYYDMEQNQGRSVHTAATSANYTTSDYLNIGSFLLGKFYPLEDSSLVVTAGARYDHFKVNVDTQYGEGTVRERRLKKTSRVHSFVPSLGVAYSPLDFLKLRSSYGYAFKMPTPRQLGGVYTYGGESLFIGNPDLKPEKSRSWDAGFDMAHSGLTGSFTYFRTNYKDKIIALSPDSRKERHHKNLEKAYVNGVELALAFDVGEFFEQPYTLEPYANLTHLTKFEDGKGYPLTDVARNTFSWGLKFKHPDWGLQSSLDITYYDSRPNSRSGKQSQTYTAGGASVVDFSLSQRVYGFDEGGELSLKLGVKNMFNKYYTTNTDDAMPGRSVYLGVAYDF